MNEVTPRILVSPVGEASRTVLSFPLVCALRDKYPSAQIVWAMDKAAATLARSHAAIDAIVELPAGWNRSPRAISRTRQLLRRERFDVSLDLRGTAGSAMLCRMAEAPMRIGPAASTTKPWRCLNNHRITPVFRHWTDRSLELLIPLGIHSPRMRWEVPISTNARAWAMRLRHAIGTDRLALLSPHAACPARHWEAGKFAATARYLRGRYRYRTLVLWGSDAQRQAAAAIVRESDGAATLAPAADLHHQAALIQTAGLLIGVDSAPLHLAAALNTCCIGLYGATRSSHTGPYGNAAVQVAYQRASRRQRFSSDNTAMRAIAVINLCDAIDQLHVRRRLLDVA